MSYNSTRKNVDNTVEYTHGGNTYTDHKNEWIEGTTAVYDVDKWYESNGYQETADGNSASLRWSSRIYLPDEDITGDKVTYTDTLTAAGGDNYNTPLEGMHYTTPAQLKDIEVWTTTKDNQAGDTLTRGTDFDIYDMSVDPGTKITNYDDTETHITNFKIVFTDEGLRKLNTKKGGSVNLRYHTTASYEDQQAKTNRRFSNRGEIPGHHKDATFDHYKNLTLEKLSSATGPDTQNLGGYYNYGKNGIVVDKEDGVIYYRVTFYVPADWNRDTAVELTDTFPAGLTYKDGSVSARFYSNDDDIRTQDGLTATASKPEDAGNGQTKVKFTVNGFQPGNTYLIYYQATFDKDSFWTNGDAKQKEYENKIEWNGHEDTTKTTVEKDSKVLKKDGAVIQETDANGTITGKGYITYHLTVNPGAADLDTKKDTLTLTDTIGQDQSRESKLYIDTDTIKVYQYDPSMPNNMGSELNSSRYTYQYDEKTQKLTLTIPDQLACVVSYRYNFEAGKNDETITNNAELSGDVTNTVSNTSKVEGSTSKATTNQNELIVYKVDSKDDKVRLKGVTFELYEYAGKREGATEDWDVNWNKVTFTDPDGNSKVTTKVTDENGEITFTTIDDGLKTNTVYKLVETSVGDNKGYSVSDKAMYFIFPGKIGDNESPTLNQITAYIQTQYGVGYIAGADNITLANGIITYYFKDEQKNSIQVNKVWLNADGKDMNDPSLKATVRLMRKYQTEKTVTTLLPKVDVTVHIKNTRGENVDKTVPVLKDNADAVIFVTGNNSNGTLCYPDATGGKDENNELSKATMDHGGWASQEYYIPVGSQSASGAEFTIVGNDIGWNWMGQISLTASPSITRTTTGTVDVKERAKDANGNEIPDQVLTSATNWSYMWTDLPADNNGKQVSYYLEEVSVDGFTTTITNNGGIQAGTILVTNKSRTQVKHVSFDFNKKWTNEAGATADWAKDITVTLSAAPTAGGDTKSTKFMIHQNKDGSFKATKVADSDVNGGITSYVLSGSQNEDGSYKLKFSDLPDGYTYSVTEDKVDGYNLPTYRNGTSAGQGETITNSPETPTYSLPATGGPGPIRYIGGGLLLMLLALLLIYKNTHERRKDLS